MTNDWTALSALSPLDGRYSSETTELKEFFSESALIKHRLFIEVLYLIELMEFLDQEKISQTTKNKLIKWAKNPTPKDLARVKRIEAKISHDVKAIEYFIRSHFKKIKLTKLSFWIHWGLTSTDIDNLAYGLMIQKAKDKILIPSQLQLIKLLLQIAKKYSSLVMPGRTHGQIAVPTTLGKELIVFASRASFFLEKIKDFKLGGKLNGAVGNFNGHQQIFPHKNWCSFSKKFVEKLGLESTIISTQIEPGSRLVYFLDNLRQLNNVWLNLSQDCWRYISDNYFIQRIVQKEVGSSTMPHKVNPINFENAEANLQLANNLLMFFSNKLSLSRLQRDLSDKTAKRSLGTAFAYSLLASKSLIKGLNKIQPKKRFLDKELKDHPEMLLEALQLILKVWKKEKAYEEIKQKTRGKKISWKKLIEQLNISKKKKGFLKKWQTKDYAGLASKLTIMEIKKINKTLQIPR